LLLGLVALCREGREQPSLEEGLIKEFREKANKIMGE
jgi:hypothetical protein